MLEDTYVKALSVILLKTCPQSTKICSTFTSLKIYSLFLLLPLYDSEYWHRISLKCSFHIGKQPFIVHFLLYVVKFESCNNLSLLDNNECGSQPSLCGAKGICQNTPGSFSCECQRGFSLDATGLNCEGEFICSKTFNHIQHTVFFFLPSH